MAFNIKLAIEKKPVEIKWSIWNLETVHLNKSLTVKETHKTISKICLDKVTNTVSAAYKYVSLQPCSIFFLREFNFCTFLAYLINISKNYDENEIRLKCTTYKKHNYHSLGKCPS